MSTTTIAEQVPERIEVDSGAGQDEAVLVGPAMRGWVYQSTQGRTWYRLIPVESTTMRWRHRLQSECGQLDPQSALVPGQQRQVTCGIRGFLISYPDEAESVSFSRSLESPDAAVRIRAAIAALEALPRWWRNFSAPVYPLPAEMILGADGRMRLLWIPQGPTPDIETVFSDPRRAVYLPPELVRSSHRVAWDMSAWEGLDRYVLSIGLLSVFFELPELARPETTLFRTASGSLLSRLEPRVDVPPWLDRFATHRRTITGLRKLASPSRTIRQEIDLTKMATQLQQTLELADPYVAVSRLRDSARADEAFEVLQEIFPLMQSLSLDSDVRYGLLLLAGELCGLYLRRPLDALDNLERAIELRPQRMDAYRDQLRLVAAVRHHTALAALIESSPHMGTELDTRIWRDYHALAQQRSYHADDEQGQNDDRAMAGYLLWRRQYAAACRFIFPRLSDGRGEYIWWDFDLNLGYVEAILGMETGDGTCITRAAEQLQGVKDGLQFVQKNLSLEETLIHQFGSRAADLEHQLWQLRQSQSTTPGPGSAPLTN